jgi:hypothetical protein
MNYMIMCCGHNIIMSFDKYVQSPAGGDLSNM